MKLPGTMRVPDDLRRRIVDLAVRDDRSMSSAIRMILRAGLRTLEKTAETTFEPDFSDDEIAGDVLAIDALGADQATA
jgi:plasmid stability protein